MENALIDIQKKLACIMDYISRKEVSKTVTFHEYILYWFDSYKKPFDGERALSSISICIRKYLMPKLEKYNISDITKEIVFEVLEGIPYKRQKEISYNILNGCFRVALQEGVIEVNPVVLIKKPKAVCKSWEAMTREEQERFLIVIKGHKMELLFKSYLLTGCRLRELLNLQWTDIDYRQNRICIRGTKTVNSLRMIPLTKELQDIFLQVLKTGDYVFTYKADYVYRQLKDVFHSLGLNNFSTHCLRHTFATRCVENGVEPHVLRKWLGHASITTTLNIYTHVQSDFENEQVMKISGLLQN